MPPPVVCLNGGLVSGDMCLLLFCQWVVILPASGFRPEPVFRSSRGPQTNPEGGIRSRECARPLPFHIFPYVGKVLFPDKKIIPFLDPGGPDTRRICLRRARLFVKREISRPMKPEAQGRRISPRQNRRFFCTGCRSGGGACPCWDRTVSRSRRKVPT